jgi:hypothetical protein
MKKDDLLNGCNERGVPLDEFTAMFCNRCKQPKCSRSAFGTPLMEQRVREQERRLLHPERADHTLAKYVQIVNAGFKDMLHRAVQLEISDQRGDWEIPEIPILDGQVEVSPSDAVDAAVRAMSRHTGGGGQDPEPDEEPSVAAEPEPEPKTVEPDPPPPPKPETPVVRPTAMNTATPQGVILGDEPVTELAEAKKKEPPADPWAIPEGVVPAKKAKVGATIKMGGGD